MTALTTRARRSAPVFAVVVVGLATAMTVATTTRLAALNERVPGVWSSGQLLPAPQATVHDVIGAFTADPAGTPGDLGVPSEAQAADDLRGRLAALSADVAVTTWRRDGDAVAAVAVAEIAEDAVGVARSLDGGRAGGLQSLRSWPVGTRFVVVVGAAVSDVAGSARFADAVAAQVRAWVQLARAVWFLVTAIVPAVTLAVAVVAVLLATYVVRAAALLVWVILGLVYLLLVKLPLSRLARGRRGSTRRPRVPAGRPAAGPAPGLAPHVQSISVDRSRTWAAQWRANTSWSLISMALALPALTPTFWPGSIVWTAAAGAWLLLTVMASGRRAATLVRLAILAAAATTLGRALFGVGPDNRTADAGIAVAIVAVAVVTLVTFARDMLRVGPRRSYAPALSDVAPRSVVYLLAGVGTLLAGVCLFLGSNGDTDVESHLASKGIAVAGLLAVPPVARRYRAATDAAQREWARQNMVAEVLLLRSFVDDDLTVRSRMRDRHGLERFAVRFSEPFEDVVVRAVEALGPVVAIAAPGTREQEFGAARDRILVEDWLTAVKAAMVESGVVVAILGRGEGLRTELEALCDLDRLGRLCLIVPPIEAADASSRLTVATTVAEGSKGWGRIESDRVDDQDVLALVGDGDERFVVVCRDRSSVAPYMLLGQWLAELWGPAGGHRRQGGRSSPDLLPEPSRGTPAP